MRDEQPDGQDDDFDYESRLRSSKPRDSRVQTVKVVKKECDDSRLMEDAYMNEDENARKIEHDIKNLEKKYSGDDHPVTRKFISSDPIIDDSQERRMKALRDLEKSDTSRQRLSA